MIVDGMVIILRIMAAIKIHLEIIIHHGIIQHPSIKILKQLKDYVANH